MRVGWKPRVKCRTVEHPMDEIGTVEIFTAEPRSA